MIWPFRRRAIAAPPPAAPIIDPTISAARTLAVHGAERRRVAERERKLAFHRDMRARLGLAPDPRLDPPATRG